MINKGEIMKIIKNLILLVLVLSIALSMVACKGCNEESETKREGETYGTHVNNVTDTDKKFISNGKTEYSLVIPAKCGELTNARAITNR